MISYKSRDRYRIKSCAQKVLSLFAFLLISHAVIAQPANDSCTKAIAINITGGGFDIGPFTSAQTDLTSATLQPGESFAPSIITAGLNKKSVWYKFTLPTTRSVRISLAQPGSSIQAGNVGFAVYKTSSCLPGDPQISTKLSPIETFGSTFHPCVADGEYYIQVSSTIGASGPIFIAVQIDPGSPAPYDKPSTAYKFGSLTPNQQVFKDVDIECQSIDDANEVCLSATSFKDYTKSIWYTFTTPAYFDYLNTWFASITTPTSSPSIKIGYRLYQGDGTTTPIASLTQIGGCDSLMTDIYALDKKQYKCGVLLPNTTYTVQLLFHKDFKNTVRFGADWNGSKPTNGPLPISSLATSNKMGTLAANSSTYGIMTPVSDVFGCNSRHNQNSCPKSMPTSGILFNGVLFNLSSFVSFTLAGTSSVYINASTVSCSGYLLLRLYKQDLTANCTDLDTANLISTFWYNTYGSNPIACMAPGNYVLQVMAVDSTRPRNYYSSGSLYTYPSNNFCFNMGLGSSYTLNIYVRTEVASNKFDLSSPGKFEKINANGAGVMQPLLRNVTYTAVKDTFGCANTVMPTDTLCNPNYYGYLGKASYREFVLADSSMLFFDQHNTYNSKLYLGDADALTTAQNKHTYPERFSGLVPASKCFAYYNSGYSPYACAVPGTYTNASFENRLSYASNLAITPRSGKSKYGSPSTAQNMGDLWSYIPVNTWFQSGLDTFACYDNPVTIDGVAPCNSQQGQPSTKLIYRQFYLSKPTLLSIRNYVYSDPYGYGVFTLFKGKATDGIDSLKKVSAAWTCFTSGGSNGQCDAVPAGWYTVVSYGSGPTFANPTGGMNPTTNDHNSSLGRLDKFMIYLGQACAPPKFNRPFKASIDTLTGQPYKVQWAPQTGHTAAYPRLGKTITLNMENFDCTQDTTFIRQQINSCSSTDAKVVFYVFTTTQEGYVKVTVPSSFWSSVYAFDVRTGDSVKLKNGIDTALHPCTNKSGFLEFCRLQPGTYTLVIFVPSNYTCNNVSPTIYIDSVGTSRFDHAANAYDFGDIKPDSSWYNGKIGDVNPFGTGRPPSNDFFYCTTGAQLKDPDNGQGCYTQYNPYIYPARTNQVLHPVYSQSGPYVDRRTLWHTFTVSRPGTIRVKVNGRKGSENIIPNFAVYSSDADGTTPFSTLQTNGLVDSTLLQGLTFKVNNLYYYCWYRSPLNVISFYNEPCNFRPARYYIVTDIYYADDPNFQIDVEVLLDSVTAQPPKFDHYSQANDLGLVNSGIKRGDVDNFTCATRDLSDPVYSYTTCQKTLWYKFTTTATGQIRYAAFFKNTNNYYFDQIQLFKQIRPNDSSATGLMYMPYTTTFSNNGTWAQRCIEPGTYYIILPGCNAVDEDVYPQIEIIPQAGDFCSAPMVTGLTGPGTRVVPVTIDCHTIGTDYGEFNPTLTCPANAVTNNYKTSWYRLDITGTDTLDVTVYINENTNATSTDIKYRMMTGSCAAMQEQSCVQDALTRNTYKCLAPGNSYYIQVFSPTIYNGSQVTGTIDLNLAAVVHADSCFPANNCIGVANFTPKFDCTKDKNALFTNFSTYGSAITYQWDLGHNNQTSTAVSPSYFYPALTTAATYTVKLVLTNTTAGCNKKDSSIQTITIPARPAVDLGRDTLNCTNGITVPLNATSHTGSTYAWYNGSTQPTITIGGMVSPWVEVTYNGCKARDTINIWINPIVKRALQTTALCNVTTVTLTANRGQGEQYKWNTGAVTGSINVSQPGIYWADLYLNGCTMRDSFQVVSADLKPLGNDTAICQRNMPYTANATVNGATSYKWQNNATSPTFMVTQPGQYWVEISLGGCTFRDTIVVAVDSFKTVNRNARICQGQTYTLPSGQVVNTSGIYRDTLRNARGCDTLISSITLRIDSVQRMNTGASVCAGQTYTLPSGLVVSLPGTYSDTVRYRSGCDSIITATTLSIKPLFRSTNNPSICAGQTYTLPSGIIVNTTGTFSDTIRYRTGCDSLISTTNLQVKSLIRRSTTNTICAGQTFTLPSGVIVSAAGVYNDTMKYVMGGCDSLISTVTLSVKTVARVSATPSICAGQTYTLPSGVVVNIAGNYVDTLRYNTGCDSLITTTTLAVKPLFRSNRSATICAGQTYTLPSGTIVNSTGTFSDTIRYRSGCDSLISTTNLSVKALTRRGTNTAICQGQTFTLPSGVIVSAAGVYNDTMKYVMGCDSLISTVTIAVKTVARVSATPSICAGQTYTLPSGVAVNVAGNYVDTLRYNTGCDSLITTTNLSVKPLFRSNRSATICAGQTYTLPSGSIVNTTGTFSDTIRYRTGCDSLISTTNLSVRTLTRRSTNTAICQGQTFTLPSGVIVSAAGVYNDTMKYVMGCDSLISTVTIAVKTVARVSATPSICAGQTYTLPSGVAVNVAGNYVDTLRYNTGCDSLITTTNLSVKPLVRRAANPIVCAGQTFTTPSGLVLATSGTYNDTLRYNSGCDSLITAINLTVRLLARNSIQPSICAGRTYTLPSGIIVNAAGVYNDTLRYRAGCDSVINTVTLSVQSISRVASAASICAGNNYILPSGAIVNTPGIFVDTVRYRTGCDSLISTVTITLKAATRTPVAAVICEGTSYTLPSGALVNSSGIFNDTLRYAGGCDSVITTLNLLVKPVTRTATSAAICSGASYVLPSGNVVNATGIYRDSIRYRTGCDSLITTVALQVKQPTLTTTNPSICAGQTYTLPSGSVVSAAGNYTDVIKDRFGCDSVVTTIRLTINPNPTITLSKSNDINCIVGSATLTATGGRTYAWSPANNVSNPVVQNPVVSPSVTTTYKVSVTTNRLCTSVDSIIVVVNKGDAEGGYLLPSAFTPNGDGKNECFGVKAWGFVTGLEMYVYDRWGNTMFTTNDASRCWDGTYKGEKMSSGAYVYYIKAITICGPVMRKGTIVLIR